MKVYFISGLGADKRAFERITLPAHFSIHYLDWIKPAKKESLNDYARRLAAAIDSSQPFALVGLSMGGMMAAAMNRFVQPQKTILVSSVGCAGELPPFFKIIGRSRLYKLLPEYLLHHPNFLAYVLFGATTKKEKSLLHYIISSSDPAFIKWGIGAIVNWKDQERPKNLYHIHGDKDRILPVKYTRPDVIVPNGSHFMVWTKAGQVSRLITEFLEA